MIFNDFKCLECKETFIVTKKHIMDDFKPGNCPKCKSSNVQRIWMLNAFSVAEGKCGNAKNGYSQGFVNHSSELGKYKGKKI